MQAGGRYSAYGLVIDSNRPLPGATPTGASAVDLTIDFIDDAAPSVDGAARRTTDRLGWQSTTRLASGDLLFRCASDGGASAWTLELSRDGSCIEVRSPPKLTDVTSYVVTRGLAASLVVRGTPLLHACAIEAAGGAMLVAGASGAGKSSLAAAALASGRALLTDDVAALVWHDNGLHVEPGLAQLRLEAATAAMLGWDPSGLPTVFVDPRLPRKRRLDLSPRDGSFCRDPRIVTAIHVLGPRSADGPHIKRLSPTQALPLLLRNTFATDLLNRADVAAILPFWARIAREIPIYEVRPAAEVRALPPLIRDLPGRHGEASHAESRRPARSAS